MSDKVRSEQYIIAHASAQPADAAAEIRLDLGIDIERMFWYDANRTVVLLIPAVGCTPAQED